VPIEIWANNDSMFWTDKGLKKPYELDINDLILGVDMSGDICWRKVVQRPIGRGLTDCNQIISDFTEIHAPHDTILCTQSIDRRFCKIEEIDRMDKLRVISNPAYVWEKWSYKEDNFFSVDMAFLLGVVYRRVALDQDRVVVKIPIEKIDSVVRTVERKTFSLEDSKKNEITLEHGPLVGNRRSPWSWLIIKSQRLSSIIKSVLGDAREAPLAVRADLKLYQSYVKGLMEVLGQKEGQYTSFETFLNEYNARKLLYNIFFLYGVECKTNAEPSYSPNKIVINVKDSELQRMSSTPYTGLRGKKSVSKVRWIISHRTSTHCIQVEGTSWSPIVDLVYIL